MKVKHCALLMTCLIMVIGAWPVAAIQLLDVLFLSDGTSITGVIVEEEPGKSLVLETEDGELLEYRFKDVERIEKLFVEEEPLIQNRDVVYLEDGVVFQGNCHMGDVVEPPERRMRDSAIDLEEEESEELEEAEV